MRTDITRDFEMAEKKGLKVFYNNLGIFEIKKENKIICVNDRDGTIEKVKKIINEFNS